MKRLITFLLLFAAIKVAGQTTGYLRFDTVRIMKQNGTCELYIINATKDSTGGILTNIGGGLTSFKKSRSVGDTLFVGGDTVIFSGAGSSKLDSVTIETATDPDPDTLYQWTGGARSLVGLIPKGGGISSSDTTYTLPPIEVRTGPNDTLALRYGYGLTTTASDTTLVVDTLNITTKADRQKLADSLGALIDDAAVIPTFQQVTGAGQVTTDSVKIRRLTVDSSLYAPIRAALDSINTATRRGDIRFDTTTNSMMYRDNNFWTYFATLSNSLIPNRPNMRIIASVIRPVVDGTTITWQHLVDPLHDSVGFAPVTCDGSSINLNLIAEAAKIITIQAQPDETLAQYIDCGVSFMTTHARLYLKRRIGVISGYFQGNGTTYAWTGTGGVTLTYNTANGQLNFDFNSDYTPTSNGTAVRYAGTNGYTLKRLFSGLSGNDRGYQLTDEFGNGVVGVPTSADVIEVVVPEQTKPATINPCTAGGDGWAAYIFGGGLANIWIIGLVEY